jgi:O-antigen ligase
MKPRSYRRLFYVGAAVGVAVVMFLGQEAFWNRMSTIQTAVESRGDPASPAATRLAVINLQLKLAAEHPFGIGHRGIVVLAPSYLPAEHLARQGSRSSHNTYLTVLSEQGVPGAVLIGALMLWVLKTVWRMRDLRHRPDLTRLAGQVAVLAAMLTVSAVGGLGVDYLKAEVQIWGLVLLTVLSVEYSIMHTVRESGPASDARVEGLRPARWSG